MYDGDVEKQFEDILKQGLESQMRQEAKEEGIRNWKDAKIFPVVALVPHIYEHTCVIGAILVGIPEEDGDCSMILTTAPDEQLPETLLEWVQSKNQDEGNYYEDNYVELLFNYRRAIVALELDTQYAHKHGWNKLMEEVLAGNRSTNRNKIVMGGAEMVYNNLEGLEFIADLINKLNGLSPMEQWDASFIDLSDHIKYEDPTIDGGFEDDFKDGWV